MTFRFRTESHLDTTEAAVLHSLRADLQAMHATTAENERFSTADVRDAMTPVLELRGFTYTSKHGAFTDSTGVALTVHGGRAFTNNEVVWRLLQLAGAPAVRAVVAVVPHTYKGSACASKVEAQLEDLAKNPGVAIDIEWAAHIAYQM